MQQLCLTDAPNARRMRLPDFERVELKPRESRQVSLTADPRQQPQVDGDAGQWRIAPATTSAAGREAH